MADASSHLIQVPYENSNHGRTEKTGARLYTGSRCYHTRNNDASTGELGAQSSTIDVLTTLCSPVNFRKLLTNSLLLKNKHEMSVLDILFITYTTEPRKQASDLSSTTRLGKAAVERCYEARDYSLLNSSLSLLCKKHGQLKGVVQALVEQAIGWLK